MVKALRLVRLVRRLGPLRRMISALGQSVLPVCQAMFLVFMVICIWGVMGVSLYQDRSEELFGTFARAIYTMFMVSTLEGWNDAARELDVIDEDGIDIGAAFFFCSFIIIAAWTLIPVVIAVLLESFTLAARHEEEKEEQERLQQAKGAFAEHHLDVVFEHLLHYENDSDFSKKIQDLFKLLDADGSEWLSFQELVQGLRKIPKFSHLHIAEEDFEALCKRQEILDKKGISLLSFERVMRAEVREYVMRLMAQASDLQSSQDHSTSLLLSAMKFLLTSMDKISEPSAVRPQREKSQLDEILQRIMSLESLVKGIRNGDEPKISGDKHNPDAHGAVWAVRAESVTRRSGSMGVAENGNHERHGLEKKGSWRSRALSRRAADATSTSVSAAEPKVPEVQSNANMSSVEFSKHSNNLSPVVADVSPSGRTRENTGNGDSGSSPAPQEPRKDDTSVTTVPKPDNPALRSVAFPVDIEGAVFPKPNPKPSPRASSRRAVTRVIAHQVASDLRRENNGDGVEMNGHKAISATPPPESIEVQNQKLSPRKSKRRSQTDPPSTVAPVPDLYRNRASPGNNVAGHHMKGGVGRSNSAQASMGSRTHSQLSLSVPHSSEAVLVQPQGFGF
mmetsp:Transcript_13176/g.20680  ORF Transcript_13176/g.20680 Transcript_13176/m.20680 type:complete len:620 (+) Transcript_13176:3-1862(+)